MKERHASALVLLTAALAAGSVTAGGTIRRIDDPARGPDLRAAFQASDQQLIVAVDRSLSWFDRPGSRRLFPLEDPPITHARARQSLVVFRELLVNAADPDTFVAQFQRRFDLYESVGSDGEGRVLFTAYFAPEYPASRRRTPRFHTPIHRPPPGYSADAPWHTRREIEDGNLLAGRELAWLDSSLNAYLVHVNGSAQLRLPDGETIHVGHDGTNGRSYTSLGKLLIAQGLVDPQEISLQAIREIFDRDPDRVESLMRRNDRFVFFRELPVGQWPQSALGVPLTAGCSLATDKEVFPPGGLVLVETTLARAGQNPQTHLRFMLDQDTGGAIKGPGRADMYLGVGPDAGAVAGLQKQRGRLFYLFLKDNRTDTR